MPGVGKAVRVRDARKLCSAAITVLGGLGSLTERISSVIPARLRKMLSVSSSSTGLWVAAVRISRLGEGETVNDGRAPLSSASVSSAPWLSCAL